MESIYIALFSTKLKALDTHKHQVITEMSSGRFNC